MRNNENNIKKETAALQFVNLGWEYTQPSWTISQI